MTALLRIVGVLLGGGAGERDSGSLSGFSVSVRDIPRRARLVGRAIGLLDGLARQLNLGVDAPEIAARHTGTR